MWVVVARTDSIRLVAMMSLGPRNGRPVGRRRPAGPALTRRPHLAAGELRSSRPVPLPLSDSPSDTAATRSCGSCYRFDGLLRTHDGTRSACTPVIGSRSQGRRTRSLGHRRVGTSAAGRYEPLQIDGKKFATSTVRVTRWCRTSTGRKGRHPSAVAPRRRYRCRLSRTSHERQDRSSGDSRYAGSRAVEKKRG